MSAAALANLTVLPLPPRDELEALRRTVEVLMDQVERQMADGGSGQINLLRQNHQLESIIGLKTSEIEAQRAALERALEEVRRTHGELLETHKLTAIGQLAAGVAHEINTPIQFISDNAVFLERSFTLVLTLVAAWRPVVERALATDGLVPPEIRAEVETAARKCKLDYLRREVPSALTGTREGLTRVASIVRALKEFAHPSGDVPAEVEFASLVETAVTVGRNEWKYVAEVETDVQIPAFLGIRDRLSQVVLNLLVNAAHAIGEVVGPAGERGKGLIRIVGRSDDGHVELRVSDTGVGMSPDLVTRIFEPFFTTKPVGKGTGQGLALARSVIVDLHHGSIGVESTVGVGTTFILRMPHRAPSSEENV